MRIKIKIMMNRWIQLKKEKYFVNSLQWVKIINKKNNVNYKENYNQ